ncbi:MAG TPA: hypothetical protein VNY56_09215 [Methylomirabilota bacterium]|jgi:hypothetical protein|nr:hypothetical protein [Methylomirabilota bacterium]
MMAETKQKKQLIVLAVLVVVAASIWYLHFGGEATRNAGVSAVNYSPINAQDYNPIISGLAKAQSTEYKSAGRNIFVMGAATVEAERRGPVKPPFIPYNQPQPPAPPPPAQLPMVFFGYGMLPVGGARQAFLKEESGDEVHIVSEGDVVLSHIRILHIGNDRIDFEDMTTGQKGSKNLEAAPAA